MGKFFNDELEISSDESNEENAYKLNNESISQCKNMCSEQKFLNC